MIFYKLNKEYNFPCGFNDDIKIIAKNEFDGDWSYALMWLLKC